MLTRLKSKMATPTIKDLHDLLLTLQSNQKASDLKIDQLLSEIQNKDKKIASLESRVDLLESTVAVLKNTANLLAIKCDDNEQYSRRPSIRITGIPSSGYRETADKCVELVVGTLNSIPGIKISKNDIQRAHRIGKNVVVDRVNVDGGQVNKSPRQMIVKFKSWDVRTSVFKGRKSLKEHKIFLDLTKRRFALKNLAIEKAKRYEQVQFVCNDINCSLCIKLNNDEFKYFNSEDELDKILSSL